MSPMQQLLLGVGASTKVTYIDDIFSNQVYTGTGSAKTITNGINLGTDGGLVITKNRDSSSHWAWGSPLAAVGTGKYNRPNTMFGALTDANSYTAFNNNGYTIGSSSVLNNNGDNFVSYSFKKTPGLIDVISYVGNDASSRVLSHDLGSVPGWIAIICTTKYENKTTWHRGFGERVSGSASEYYAFLDGNSAARNTSAAYPALPTATELTIGSYININNETYVAYIFAGGESTASTAHSCSFNGSSSDLQQSSSSDLAFGTGDYTVECWVKPNSLSSTLETLFDSGGNSNNTDTFYFGYSQSQVHVGTWTNYVNQASTTMVNGQWTHIAACRSGSTMRIFKNGILLKSVTDNTNWASNANITIGRNRTGAQWVNGSISNLRVIKGTALYTSSFKPPTAPLTNVTNTVLLTLNNSSATGATVSPGTWTNSNVTASTDSPFDDPAGFVFGDSQEGVIKCGSFVGAGSSAVDVNIGFEPSWVIIKNASVSENWFVFDNLRGVTTGGNDNRLQADSTGSEFTTFDYLEFNSTGFKVNGNATAGVNGNGNTMTFVAIRRSDGYVGKPYGAGEGTSVFAIDTGNGSANGPAFDSNFAVDFTFSKEPASSGYWIATARLINKWLKLNETDAGASLSSYERYDFSKGVHQQYTSSNQAWMFKRHAGFDVVAYTPKFSGSGFEPIRHNLGPNNVPEMIWVKNIEDGGTNDQWAVYHKDLSNTPYNNALHLNEAKNINNISNQQYYWGQAFTSQFFYVYNGQSRTGDQGTKYLAMLFSSVDGISSAGSYSGSNSSQTITLGFQPRFIIIKNINDTRNWQVLDTTRGWGSGNDCRLFMDITESQICTSDVGAPTSTGFTLTGGNQRWSIAGDTYIYYAHA